MGGQDKDNEDRAVWDLEYRAELKSTLRRTFGRGFLKGLALDSFAAREEKRDAAKIIPFQAKKARRG